MKAAFRLLLLAAAFAMVFTPTVAGIGAGNWEVGFDMGGARLDPEVTDRGAFYFGVRGGYCATNLLQIEGQFAGAGTEADPTGEDVFGFFLNFVFNFRPKRPIVPYALVGGGESTLGFTDESGPYRVIIQDDATTFQIAVGSRFYLRPDGQLAIRVELGESTETGFDERKYHGHVAVGVSWRLGKAP